MNLEEWLRSQIGVLKDDPEAIEIQKELDENWVKKRKGFWQSAIGRYLLSILVSVDQFVMVVISPIVSGKVGNPDETISSRLGKLKRKYGGTIPWFRPLSGLIDWGLDKIDPGHSIDAIEEDSILICWKCGQKLI